jgi:hypothetical protein
MHFQNLLPLLTGQPQSYILLDMSDKKQSNYWWVLTPKFGKESDCGSSSVRSPFGGRKGFFLMYSAKKSAVGYLLPIRQRNSRADFAGLDGDVAQAGRTNGWIGDQA